MREITDKQYEEILSKEGVFLVDMYADWCGPCKRLTPLLEDLAKSFEGSAEFVKINVDENPETPAKLHVRGIPTVALIKNGEVKEVLVGVQPQDVYREKVQALLD